MLGMNPNIVCRGACADGSERGVERGRDVCENINEPYKKLEKTSLEKAQTSTDIKAQENTNREIQSTQEGEEKLGVTD